MSEKTPPALAVEDLRIETAHGSEIVADVSFELERGEVLALVGESGCGKTSTALALLGHSRLGTRIASGSVRVGGQDLLRLSPAGLRRVRGSEVSYVPQDPTAGLNPRHRVGAQIAETLVVHGTSRSRAKEDVLQLVQRVDLPADERFLQRYPFELSGGQQQRVAIAMALICRPVVVVLDEPTTGLDVVTQATILGLLSDLSKETGAGFVYVTHDLAVVDRLADRVAVMYAGRIVELGRRESALDRPRHPYTAMLLASVPRIATHRPLTGLAGTAPPPGSRPKGCFFEPRCPLAVKRCRDQFPPSEVSDNGHIVRCWRAGDGLPSPAAVRSEHAGHARSDALFIADHIVAAYGRGPTRSSAIRDVSFSVATGECLALVGESGSGKTTLGRCVVGLHSPAEGSFMLHGKTLGASVKERTRADRQAIQIVFQNPHRSLNPRERVGDAIQRPLRLFGMTDRVAMRRRAAGLLEQVRLSATALGRYPGELSGGEKQRVAIARALAANPLLLVCDEITSSLDVSTQAAILSLLEELRKDGLSLLFITHNLALVHSIADRVLVLQGGEMRDYGDTRMVMRQPSHPYVQELLAAAPDLSSVS